MFENQENVFYYITTLNENYPHPEMKKGQEESIIKGMYLFQQGGKGSKRVQLDPFRSFTSLLKKIHAFDDALFLSFFHFRMRIIFIECGDVVKNIFLIFEHPLQTVLDDHHQFKGKCWIIRDTIRYIGQCTELYLL